MSDLPPTQEELIAQVLHDSRNPHRRIRNKQENYALFHAGLYGNRPHTWRTYKEIVRSGWIGEEISIRDFFGTERSNPQKHLPLFHVPFSSLEETINDLLRRGVNKERMTFNESTPDHHLLLQGEIATIGGVYHLTYSRAKKPMAEALLTGPQSLVGGKVRLLLMQALDPASFLDIETCLHEFSTEPTKDSAVVEFSTYETNVGVIPGRNTLIWEVRNY